MDDINFELNANSARNPVNSKNLGKIAALKKLYRSENLYKHGKQRLLHRELDVIHIVRSMRTMQNFVTNYLNADQRQLIEYQKDDLLDSEFEEARGFKSGIRTGAKRGVQYLDNN